MAVIDRDPILPVAEETTALRELDSWLSAEQPEDPALVGANCCPRPLPRSVAQALARVVHELAQGNAVSVVPIHAELTTQQAADLLNVSRPFLIKLLDSGEISYHRAGTHRRVRAADVLAYRDRRRAARKAALDELAREAQAMGLYD